MIPNITITLFYELQNLFYGIIKESTRSSILISNLKIDLYVFTERKRHSIAAELSGN